MASNAYHRLDKSQNFMGNKAFAQTIINDLKQRQRQTEFQRRMNLNRDSELEDSKMTKLQRECSQEILQKQKSEIYNSSVRSSRTGKLLATANTNLRASIKSSQNNDVQVQNLKEVMHMHAS